LINNTLYDYDHGIGIGTGTPYTHSIGNILSGRAEPTGFDMIYESGTANSIVDYNLFYNSGGEKIAWGNFTPKTNADMVALGKNVNAPLPADPLHTSTTDFTLQAGSQAIDAGVEHSLYEQFLATYGLDIRVDRNDTAKPQNDIWDIGAYEYDVGYIPPALTCADTWLECTEVDCEPNGWFLHSDNVCRNYAEETNPPTCADLTQNGDEEGVDCGGSCPPCGTPAPQGLRKGAFRMAGAGGKPVNLAETVE
jgi:hypothetical protein